MADYPPHFQIQSPSYIPEQLLAADITLLVHTYVLGFCIASRQYGPSRDSDNVASSTLPHELRSYEVRSLIGFVERQPGKRSHTASRRRADVTDRNRLDRQDRDMKPRPLRFSRSLSPPPPLPVQQDKPKETTRRFVLAKSYRGDLTYLR